METEITSEPKIKGRIEVFEATAIKLNPDFNLNQFAMYNGALLDIIMESMRSYSKESKDEIRRLKKNTFR